MKVHLLSGFLGSGKTTAIRQACKMLMKQGIPVGVITNDQGIRLVDGFYFQKLGIPERQVGSGCFCCNYNDLDRSIGELIETNQPEVIFAESVGTCTDIVATVMKPLSRYRKVSGISLTTVADVRLLGMLLKEDKIFDKDVRYIYHKQLEEAGLILMNKIDLVSDVEITEAKNYLEKKYEGKQVILQNSLDVNGGAEWFAAISQQPAQAGLSSLEVDYDQYASGEAKMGYLDQQLLIRSDKGEAEEDALRIIRNFVASVRDSSATVGHIKFWLNDRHKLSFTSTDESDSEMNFPTEPSDTCSVVVNARVQMDPGKLFQMMNDAIAHSVADSELNVALIMSSFFKPGYPKPTHRIGD